MNFEQHINNGVIFRSIVDVIIDDNVVIGRGTIIDSGNHISGNTIIGNNCILDQGNIILDSNIASNTAITKSVIKRCTIGDNVTVGPFAHIHSNSTVGDNCRVGNFVEIKNASVGHDTKIAHLAYVGDVDIGDYCNVGCGAIFVNYDGKNKHRSTVGDSVFIGSNSNIIAPVNLCDNAYIAAGTTVTVDLPSDCLCIGRNREVIKENRSKYHKKYIKKYFGTDGIRGKYGQFLTEKIAFLVGNYLGYSSNNGKIVVARDNRPSGESLSISLKEGIISAGADVVDLGIAPTPCVAFATKSEEGNYGIMITASHNPTEYNGIKIFNYDGYKLSDLEEKEVELFIDKATPYFADTIGSVIDGEYLSVRYSHDLLDMTDSLDGLSIVIDCANGATAQYAPTILHQLGASTIAINRSSDGSIINYQCGATMPDKCAERVLAVHADIGVAFDGDGDRVIAIDEQGEIVDGDQLVYIIAKYLKNKGELHENTVVGTILTNLGIEQSLQNLGIDLIRTDVGDHYVMQAMQKHDAIVGGEQSGHIILSNLASTGDGIRTAIMIAQIIKETSTPLSVLNDCKRLPQASTSIDVSDKKSIINNATLKNLIAEIQEELDGNSRIIVRASGTENKIRIMVECPTQQLCSITLERIADCITSLQGK